MTGALGTHFANHMVCSDRPNHLSGDGKLPSDLQVLSEDNIPEAMGSFQPSQPNSGKKTHPFNLAAFKILRRRPIHILFLTFNGSSGLYLLSNLSILEIHMSYSVCHFFMDCRKMTILAALLVRPLQAMALVLA